MTNKQIIDIINMEVKKMPYIKADVQKIKTGIYVAFKHEYTAFCGSKPHKEYILVGVYIFHRIQKPEHIYKTLKNSSLYEERKPY